MFKIRQRGKIIYRMFRSGSRKKYYAGCEKSGSGKKHNEGR